MKKWVALVIISTSFLLFSGCTDPATQNSALDIPTDKATSIIDQTHQNPPEGNIDLDSTINNSSESIAAQGTTMPTQNSTTADTTNRQPISATQATINTTQGNITIELYRQKAPVTTDNFLQLAKVKFYDGIVFHRVIPDFMIQVGDPLTKDESKKSLWGTGGPGYSIKDEFDDSLKHDAPGTVSMANSGPNTGGSQFFITHVATQWLDGKHAVFGKVIEGMDVVNKIQVGDKIITITYE